MEVLLLSYYEKNPALSVLVIVVGTVSLSKLPWGKIFDNLAPGLSDFVKSWLNRAESRQEADIQLETDHQGHVQEMDLKRLDIESEERKHQHNLELEQEKQKGISTSFERDALSDMLGSSMDFTQTTVADNLKLMIGKLDEIDTTNREIRNKIDLIFRLVSNHSHPKQKPENDSNRD